MKDNYFSSHNVTVAVLNYNGVKMLPECFKSIKDLDSPPGEMIMVDDCSSDGSARWVRENHPDVRVVEMGFNSKLLNVVRNRAILASRFDLVLLVDNDVTLKSDCLDKLLWGLQNLSNAAVCMPRALYDHDHSLIYQDGQTLHYVGASHTLNRHSPVKDVKDSDNEPRISIGWGVQLIDKKKAAVMGNFNEKYVMGWGDDGEFNQKMNLANYLCYHIPSAVVFHKRVSGAKRYYGSVRNRWRFMLECYQWKTLAICLPALAIYEVSLIFFLLSKKAIRDYLRGMWYVVANMHSILEVRRQIQLKRKRKDSEFIGGGNIFVNPQYVESKILVIGFRMLNSFLNGYWSIAKRFL